MFGYLIFHAIVRANEEEPNFGVAFWRPCVGRGRRMDGCTYGGLLGSRSFWNWRWWLGMPREGRLVHIDTLPKMMNFCMLMILGRSMICGYKCSIHPSRECIVSWFIIPLNGWIQPLSCTYPAAWVLVGWLLFFCWWCQFYCVLLCVCLSVY